VVLPASFFKILGNSSYIRVNTESSKHSIRNYIDKAIPPQFKQLLKLRKATECIEAASTAYLKTGDGKRFTASPPLHHSL
jgi:hypothetical protein